MRISTLPLLLLLGACASHAPPGLPAPPPPVTLANWKPTLHLAEISLATGAPAIALQVTDELLAADPRDVAAQNRRGDALVALGRPREAEVAYQAALTVQPGNADSLLGLGRMRLPDDAAAAESMFAVVVVQNPRNGPALNNLGIARDLQGHHKAAQDAYRQALGVQPDSAAVQVNLGLSLALSGDAAGAVRLLRPLAAEPGATPKVRQDLALALTLSGKPEEARTVLAQDLPPDQVGPRGQRLPGAAAVIAMRRGQRSA